ncbi:DinB family protein [Rubrivirga marina]|uniref:DinB-like domain-containing protein n=1 Tax=Rubrivirga marina TaxID=1196024 RepID=A0A271J2Q6_9BACT|nr:DinB family protein [Rubrivirga marina]PAP77806.1 hypothetical protein BSZ37_15815 [Rubrivirga marina]
MTHRPEPGEFAPYFGRYVDLAPEADLGYALRPSRLAAFLRDLDPSLGARRYAPDKWTLAGVSQHVIDTERIFAARALRIARGDSTPLPGFDEVALGAAMPQDRPLAALADELDGVRASTVNLFASLSEADLLRLGTVSGHALSARAAGWILAGHERHHVRVIRERYLGT